MSKSIVAMILAKAVIFSDDENGTAFMEYTIMVALISLALLSFFGGAADSMSGTFSSIASETDPANF